LFIAIAIVVAASFNSVLYQSMFPVQHVIAMYKVIGFQLLQYAKHSTNLSLTAVPRNTMEGEVHFRAEGDLTAMCKATDASAAFGKTSVLMIL